MVDGEQRHESMGLSGVEETRVAIVENEPPPVSGDRHHGVILSDRQVAHQQESQVFGCDTGVAQSEVFGDCVILAISTAAWERSKRIHPASHTKSSTLDFINSKAVTLTPCPSHPANR